MPFSSVSDLKQSDLFKRMSILHDMSVSRLTRFVGVFNSIVAICDGIDDVATSCKNPLQQITDILLVVDDEDVIRTLHRHQVAHVSSPWP